ncbi:MAG: Mov34/MPN/PAD-1 family protein [Candidatus Hodarchaeota archaeon]
MFKEIEQCIHKASPNEACGLIFGKIEEKKNPSFSDEYYYYYNAYKFDCIKSLHKSPVAFLMNDYEKLAKLTRSYSKDYNYQLLSIFHSHPGSNYPSATDLQYIKAYYEGNLTPIKHIIWTIMNAESKELNGFIFIFNELKQISVQIRKN